MLKLKDVRDEEDEKSIEVYYDDDGYLDIRRGNSYYGQYDGLILDSDSVQTLVTFVINERCKHMPKFSNEKRAWQIAVQQGDL